MRRFLFALAVLLVFGLLSAPVAVYADEGTAIRRPTVAVLPVINNSGQKRTQYMAEVINEALYAKFTPDRYLLLDGQALEDNLRRLGIEDVRSADSRTINNALRAMGVDYSVRAEVHAVITRQRVYFPDVFLLMKTWTATVPVTFSVTNVPTGAPAYEAYFAEYAKIDFIIGFADRNYAIRIALDKVLEKFALEQINLE
jgi:hypothetical protein